MSNVDYDNKKIQWVILHLEDGRKLEFSGPQQYDSKNGKVKLKNIELLEGVELPEGMEFSKQEVGVNVEEEEPISSNARDQDELRESK